MVLDALEFVEWRQIGVVVVEMNDETDRHQVLVIMVEEQAAAGVVVQGPANRVLHEALLMLGRIDLPDFLEPDAKFRRLTFGVERVFRDQLLGQAAARTFGEQRVLAEQFHATGKGVLRLAVPADPHVAGGDAAHRAIVVIEHFGRGKTGIDLDA